ncbi:MAG: site-specific integrase [Bacteroidaceae bacterium]|nr:site-specific integrase [Bacteroidaceae bacterium]
MNKEPKDTNKVILDKYRQYLVFEKSLSANTLDAYVRDVQKLFG